jgi:hypothetical protein
MGIGLVRSSANSFDGLRFQCPNIGDIHLVKNCGCCIGGIATEIDGLYADQLLNIMLSSQSINVPNIKRHFRGGISNIPVKMKSLLSLQVSSELDFL